MDEIISKEKGKIPKKYWREIYKRDGANCGECGERMILPLEYRVLKSKVNGIAEHQRALQYLRFSFGHKKPVAFGGEDTIENIRGEHFLCNKEKKTNEKLPANKILRIRSYACRYVPELISYLEE